MLLIEEAYRGITIFFHELYTLIIDRGHYHADGNFEQIGDHHKLDDIPNWQRHAKIIEKRGDAHCVIRLRDRR